MKAVFFDIDDTLYDSTELAYRARLNAINAMIDAGLPIKDPQKVYKVLDKVIDKYGSNYPEHYNILLRELDVPWDPEIIAAGVAAYHDTKLSYLRPFPETIPVLLELREEGYLLGIISDGRPVKQWEKLIRLGLHHFFNTVVISESFGQQKPDVKLFETALAEVGCKASDALMVGDRLDKDVSGAKAAGMKSVWLRKGKYGRIRISRIKADKEIKSLIELPAILKAMGSSCKYKNKSRLTGSGVRK